MCTTLSMRFAALACHTISRALHNPRRRAAAAALLATLSYLSYPNLPAAEADPDYVSHVVVTGETVFRLSLRYGVPISTILDANAISDPDYIEVGQVLLIPKSDPSERLPSRQSLTSPPARHSQAVIHLVRRGESLLRISLRYRADLTKIVQANNLTDPDCIQAGQELIIPTAAMLTSVANPQPNPPPAYELSKASGDNDNWDGYFRITYYCLNGFMNSGKWVYRGAVAADKSTLPLGKKVIIEGLGQFTVEDRFAWDAAEKRLDIWIPTCGEAIQRGVEYRRVRVLQP